MDELTLVKINNDQRAVLAAALDADPKGLATGDGRMLAALRRRKLIAPTRDGLDYITELGRYQIRWYADDCARAWGLGQAGTWHQYVKRGTAPPATAKGTFGSSVDRPWWDPRTVLEFQRPTSAHRSGTRTSALKNMSEVDAQALIRKYRAGGREGSARALARLYGVAPTTLIAWLEEREEKPETTATRAERDRRMSANNPMEVPR